MDLTQPITLNRRTMLAGGAAAVVSLALAGQATAEEHAHHDHAQMGAGTQGVIDAALDCIKKGEACMAHCLQLFKAGDTSVAQCAITVQEMLPMCGALLQLASMNSPHLKELARVCITVCTDCEQECRKHEAKHAECKACADGCAECIRQCKALLAA